MPARKKAQTHDSLAAIFADPELAREHLERIRWKGEPYCPHCGNIGAYKLAAKAGSKRPVRPGVYKCSACRKQFSVTVGTVFERSHIPLNQWLNAVYLMCASKKGVSANQLSRMLCIQYKSAWFMCHRIRKAMESGTGGFESATGMPKKRYDLPTKKLTGTVEADETYVGGWRTGPKGGPRAGGSKEVVFALISRDGDARAFHVDSVKAAHLQGIMARHIEGTAHIMTDQMKSYLGLDAYFASHHSVDHTRKEYVRGDVHTNFAESYFSLIKRGIIGIFHHVSRKHLQRYLEEFDFRWNTRKGTDVARMQSALRQIEGKRLVYNSRALLTVGSEV